MLALPSGTSGSWRDFPAQAKGFPRRPRRIRVRVTLLVNGTRKAGEREFERDGSADEAPPAMTTSKFSSFSMPRLWYAAQE